MGDVDKKLRDMLEANAYMLEEWNGDDTLKGHKEGVDRLIAQIKEAFADEDLPKISDGTLYPLVWAKANGYCTGKEWYDRFEKLLLIDDGETWPVYTHRDIKGIARLASGLEDE